MVELRRRLVVLRRPALAAIDRDRRAAIVRVDHAIRILRIDPEAVMIAMRRGQKVERLATVGGTEQAGVQHVNRIRTLRVGKNMREVPRTLRESLVIVDARPGFATIVGAIQAAFF